MGGGDLARRVARPEEDLREVRADIHTIQAGVEELTIILARMEGRFTAIEARFAGTEDRLAQVPTITQAIAPNVTTIFAVMGMAIAPLRLTGTAP